MVPMLDFIKVECKVDAADALQKGGISPNEVKRVIYRYAAPTSLSLFF